MIAQIAERSGEVINFIVLEIDGNSGKFICLMYLSSSKAVANFTFLSEKDRSIFKIA